MSEDIGSDAMDKSARKPGAGEFNSAGFPLFEMKGFTKNYWQGPPGEDSSPGVRGYPFSSRV
jgi:hypothetical protein